MRVREVMSHSPTCCTASATAQTAAALMQKSQLGFLPVLDDAVHRVVVGVVTDRDLCLQVVARGGNGARIAVRQCMAPDPVCCGPDDDVRQALQRIQQNGFRRLPVVDAAGRIQGVLALSDLVHHGAANARELSVALSRITEPGERRHRQGCDFAAD